MAVAAESAENILCPFTNVEKFNFKTSDFNLFKERLEQVFIVNNITVADRKRAILLSSLDERSYKLLKDLCIPNSPATKQYNELIKILSDFFSPVKSIFSERLKFYRANKLKDESVAEWNVRLKGLVSSCAFTETELRTVLRDVFIIGLGDNAIRDRCMEEDPQSATMEKIMKLALVKEASLKEKVEYEASSTQIKSEPVHFGRQRRSMGRRQQSNQPHPGNSSGGAPFRSEGEQKHHDKKM